MIVPRGVDAKPETAEGNARRKRRAGLKTRTYIGQESA